MPSNYEKSVGPVGGLRSRVYEYLSAHGPHSRSHVALDMKENAGAVSRAVKELLTRRLLRRAVKGAVILTQPRVPMDADLSSPPLYNYDYVRYVGTPGKMACRVYEALRGAERTANEIAQLIGADNKLVYNALAALQRRGVVCVVGVRGVQYYGHKTTLPPLRDLP